MTSTRKLRKVVLPKLLVISLTLQTVQCMSLCETSNMRVLAKTALPVDDYKPLFTIEDTAYGVLFHKCFHYCQQSQNCIGFEICKVAEGLFRCHACCEWKKRKYYGLLEGPSFCRYFEQNFEYGTNLALHEEATLSSQHDSIHKSSNSVDGITTCPDYTYEAASTNSTDPWLLIDLKKTYDIQMVVVYARKAYPEQVDNVRIIVNNGSSNNTCGGEYLGPTSSSDVILFPCDTATRGRHIILVKRGQGYLGLCEIEIFGNG